MAKVRRLVISSCNPAMVYWPPHSFSSVLPCFYIGPASWLDYPYLAWVFLRENIAKEPSSRCRTLCGSRITVRQRRCPASHQSLRAGLRQQHTQQLHRILRRQNRPLRHQLLPAAVTPRGGGGDHAHLPGETHVRAAVPHVGHLPGGKGQRGQHRRGGGRVRLQGPVLGPAEDAAEGDVRKEVPDDLAHGALRLSTPSASPRRTSPSSSSGTPG